jgi:RimJ/RimL family protein N-acetyltransferase
MRSGVFLYMPHTHQTSDVSIVEYKRPEHRLALADGRRLQIRPIGPDDVDRLAGLFARLSPESRYRRFLSPKPRLEPRELADLTNLDYADHDALAAVDGDRDSIVGVARYARDAARPSAAHISFAVADELQGLGIGTMLAGLAVQRARDNGYELLIATTLWDNRPARALLRRLGFRACGSDQGVVELELALGARYQ